MDNSNLTEKDKFSQPVETIKKRSFKKGVILGLLILLILLFSLGAIIFFINQRTTFFGRASGNPVVGEVALENSYLFASPLSAQANGKEKIRITVFVLDSQGRGVYDKPVFLGQDARLEIKTIQGVTDNLGRAIFDVSSMTGADYLLEAKVNNQLIPQRVRVSFR